MTIQVNDRRVTEHVTSTQVPSHSSLGQQLEALGRKHMSRRLNPKWLLSRLAAASLSVPPWLAWTYYAFTAPRIVTGEWSKGGGQDLLLILWVLVHTVFGLIMAVDVIHTYWREPMWKKDGE